jgi:hypothetical protein
LAADLESEDASSFLDHEITDLKPGIERFTMIFGADSEEHCKTQVHPSEDAVLNATLRLGGHNSGHNQLQTNRSPNSQRQLTQ